MTNCSLPSSTPLRTPASLSVSYASRLLTGSGDTVDRVTAGASITARRAETILRRASQNWPADRAWPADIPRPAPAPKTNK